MINHWYPYIFLYLVTCFTLPVYLCVMTLNVLRWNWINGFLCISGTDNPVGPTQNWPHHPQPLPLALLSQSEGRMEAGLLSSVQRTSSIQGLLGQQLSSSQLSFSSSVAPPALPGPERFCPASLLENSGHRASQRAGLGQGSSLHYESHFGKWSFSSRKGFNGPAAAEGEGGTVQTIRTQVRKLHSLTLAHTFGVDTSTGWPSVKV